MPARTKQYDYDMAQGSTAAMRRLYSQWVKVANERIKTTASPKNISGAQAYKHIVQPLEGAPYVKVNAKGQTVFKTLPRDASDRERREAFKKLTDFLGSKTSTVGGIKEVKQERIENMRQQLGGAADSLTTNQIDSLLRFLGSPEGKEALSNYDSDMVVQAIAADLANRPKSGESILTRWQKWEESGASLADWMRSNGVDDYEQF